MDGLKGINCPEVAQLVAHHSDLVSADLCRDCNSCLCPFAVKMSAQVKQAVGEIEEYIRREGWPAVPQDIMKVPPHSRGLWPLLGSPEAGEGLQ